MGTYLNTLNNDPMHPASSQISELMDLRPLVAFTSACLMGED